MDKPMVVITTTGSEPQAITIAEELIQSEYAASINIISGMRTIYRFNGKVFDDQETMLIIKTLSSNFDKVQGIIKQLHTYEIPEIFGFYSDGWDSKFNNWLSQNSLPGDLFEESIQSPNSDTREEISEPD